MDGRRRLAHLVLSEGWTVSSAASFCGVSRQTASVWVSRARSEGLAQMSERSRRPKSSPSRTDGAVEEAVLRLASLYPAWGPAKLYALLWEPGQAPVCERTVARILARSGRRIQSPVKVPADPVRFERAQPNELWQVDFKGLGSRKARRESLTVLDDHSRYLLASREVASQTLHSAWSVLWDVFGEFGLPDALLTDNGSAFRNNGTWRWSSFDLRLMLLEIKPAHGRPYHPQTQGKVERLHETLELELEALPEAGLSAQPTLDAFRNRYNWKRPHQALGQRTPGAAYRPSSRPRPERMPEPFFPQDAAIRKCREDGEISFKGQIYRIGKAFARLPVGVLEDAYGKPHLCWAGKAVAPLQDFKV